MIDFDVLTNVIFKKKSHIFGYIFLNKSIPNVKNMNARRALIKNENECIKYVLKNI